MSEFEIVEKLNNSMNSSSLPIKSKTFQSFEIGESRISESAPSLLLNLNLSKKLTTNTLVDQLNQDYPEVISFFHKTLIIPPGNEKYYCINFIKFKGLSVYNKFKEIFYFIIFWSSRISFINSFICISLTINLCIYCLSHLRSDLCSPHNGDDQSNKEVTNLDFYGFLITSFALICQKVSTIVSTILLFKRLNERSSLIDVPFYYKNLNFCYNFLFVSFLSILPMLYIVCFNIFPDKVIQWLGFNVYNLFEYLLNELLTITTQTSNVLFILVDTDIITDIIQDLIESAKAQTLSVKEVIWAREEIEDRINNSFTIISIIIIGSLINVFGSMTAILYVTPISYNIILNSYFLKEYFLLMVVFSEVSKVNELSEELNNTVTRTIWTKELVDGNIAMNLFSNPISFKLLGVKLFKKDLLIQVILIVLTSLIGILYNFFVVQFNKNYE
jgi:hypothetical protein